MDILIIGNGIAGITAARTIRKLSDHNITVISSETEHFFSRTALMYIYMGHMKYEHTKPYEDWFWKKNRINLLHDHVENIDRSTRSIKLRSGEKRRYDKLILALGSQSNRPSWAGINLKGVQGLYSYQDLEKMEKATDKISEACVIGGGLIGVEMAEMLHSRGIHVTFLAREKHFWDVVLPTEEAAILEAHIKSRGIDLRLGREVQSLEGKQTVESVKTNLETIEADFVGVAIGVSPNKDLAEKAGLDVNKGILVDQYLTTSDDNIYAIGDCSEQRKPLKHRRSIEAVWYTGRMMGESVGHTLAGSPTPYTPGNWFNSAKFFDIEYQVYGEVSPKVPENISTFFWQNDGVSFRVNFDSESLKIIGLQSLGIRLRHEVADQWIANGAKVNKLISRLDKINFDPEFFARYRKSIVEHFTETFPDIKVSKPKTGILEKLLG